MAGSTPRSIELSISQSLQELTADYCLFWDAGLGAPGIKEVLACTSLPGDLWHAGLNLGMNGKPGLMDFVQPTWMLNCDAPSGVISTSWRLSLRACLVKTDVLRQVGCPSRAFDSLEGASLDWGLRLVKAGVLPRHVPSLVEQACQRNSTDLTLADEIRIIKNFSGPFWAKWAITNAVLTRYISPSASIRGWNQLNKDDTKATEGVYIREGDNGFLLSHPPMVSIIIPSIHRYPYLRVLLDQLRYQTIPPLEIIIVDQTPLGERDTAIANDFADLPIRWIFHDSAGQCTARNAAIQSAIGDLLLFLDDDVEVAPDTTRKHLETMIRLKADACAGTVHEPGEVDLSSTTMKYSVSSVFPLGNILLRKSILQKSGLFDLAYDHGARADGDLGMRVYLSGALIVQDLSNDLLHHHAPRGGLRVHGARKITAKQSRQTLLRRNIPSVTEIYLARRYFTPLQVRSYHRIMLFSTLRGGGCGPRRIVKVLLHTLLLPVTGLQLILRDGQAKKMFNHFPQVPGLDRSA